MYRPIRLPALVLPFMLNAGPLLAANQSAAPLSPASSSSAAAKGSGALTKTVVLPNAPMQNILVSLKGELRITEAQTVTWDAFASSATAAAAANAAATVRPSSASSLAALDIMQMHESFMKARLSGLESLLGTFKPLYDVLTPEQKAAADRILPQRLRSVM